jgi:23S rRNA (pseudouridine1915-N3)-methyltransferase
MATRKPAFSVPALPERPPSPPVRRLVFVIGGADGLDATVLAAANEKLAFGPQTWPHALARAMLAEQVYRAVTILGGSPYHRD